MARLTILIGVLLTLLGVGFYGMAAIGADKSPSPTALIPAFAGVPILLLGCVALRDAYRKHAMHVVALLALLGFLLPVGRLGMKLAQGEPPHATILVSLLLMAALCGLLLAACVRSFVRARLNAKAT